MYLGTREKARWVADPAPGAGYIAAGWSANMSYMNGGAMQRNSSNSHMEYELTWGSLSRDQIAEIEDYGYGLYGDGLIYWLDPVAMDRNLFNVGWSVAKIAAEDGIPLTGLTRPERQLIGDMSLDYPLYGATYSVTEGDNARTFYCPLPDGYTAWIGAHGVANSQGLLVQPLLNGVPSGGSIGIGIQSVTTTTRFGGSVDGTSTVNGIDISVDTSASATLTFAGLMLQVLPTGVTPATGGFIAGRGNSGCKFDSKLRRVPYSLPGESIGLSAKLVEVGDWL